MSLNEDDIGRTLRREPVVGREYVDDAGRVLRVVAVGEQSVTLATTSYDGRQQTLRWSRTTWGRRVVRDLTALEEQVEHARRVVDELRREGAL